jgi:hypothetical protein
VGTIGDSHPGHGEKLSTPYTFIDIGVNLQNKELVR